MASAGSESGETQGEYQIYKFGQEHSNSSHLIYNICIIKTMSTKLERNALICRSETNSRASGPMDIMQIETLHHADKQKTEAYILDLLAWLNYLASRSKAAPKGVGAVRPLNKPAAVRSPPKTTDQPSAAIDTSQEAG